jgi:hypothetical protein
MKQHLGKLYGVYFSRVFHSICGGYTVYKSIIIQRMPSSGMWRRIDLVLTDVPSKRRFTHDLHSATSQKTAFFIVTVMKTSNLTIIIQFMGHFG